MRGAEVGNGDFAVRTTAVNPNLEFVAARDTNCPTIDASRESDSVKACAFAIPGWIGVHGNDVAPLIFAKGGLRNICWVVE